MAGRNSSPNFASGRRGKVALAAALPGALAAGEVVLGEVVLEEVVAGEVIGGEIVAVVVVGPGVDPAFEVSFAAAAAFIAAIWVS